MKTSFFEQAARAIKSRSNRTRWLSVTLCLALVVSTGTFYAFMRPGQAKVRTEKLLVCQYVPHEHDDSCYGVDEDGNIDESVILCGYADYVLHSHTDDCYDENGRLVCELPELEAHQHDSNCYSYHEYLVCDHVPAETGHQHTDECYEERVIEDGGETGTETTEGACTQEEHVHTSDCYTKTETTGERVLTCGMHEHTHDDSCYTEKTEDVLTCTAAEHVHGDGCYSPTYSNELTCNDSSEEHTHDSGCYSQVQTGTELTCGQTEHSHDGGCYTTETTRELTCGEKEHTHDDSCYSEGEGEVVEELTCGKMEHTHDENCGGSSATSSGPKTERVLICDQEETVPEDVHTSDCYETEKELICDKEELEVHIHDDSCYDEDDNLICGKLEVQEHVHGPECFIEVTVGVDDPKYTCGKTYHVHEDGCYSEDGTLLCPLEEHEHSDSCLSAVQERWICGMTAHKHDESCYNDAMELICGLEEHEHSDSCLPEPEWLCGKMEHTHDDSCYDANGELVCPLEEHQHTGLCMNPALQPEPEWKCGKIAHTHDDSCYDENGVLICELKEHEHTNLCLKSEDEVSWLCGKTAHTHDESCYDEDGVLVCGLEEHEHTYDCLKDHAIEWLCGRTEHKHGENCYDENGVLVCGLEEHTHTAFCLMEEIRDEDCICGKIAHIHDESCYDENGELICGLEEHIHTAECLPEEIKWLCGKTEHHHDESCYDENGELICGLEEHTHTAACLVEQDGRWLCGKIEHTHGPDCYDENGELICDLEEHTHTDECLLLPLTIPVTQENQYTTNSGLFDVTFRVEGPAILRRDPGEMPEEPAESPVPVESADASPDDVTAAPADDLPAPDAEDAAPTETTPADVSDAPAESNHDFRFQIDELEEGDEIFELFNKETAEEENLLDVLTVNLYCDEQQLDLSACKVTAEVKPTELMRQMVAAAKEQSALAIEDSELDAEIAEGAETSLTIEEPADIVMQVTVRELTEDQSVNTLSSMYVSGDNTAVSTDVPVIEDTVSDITSEAESGTQNQEPNETITTTLSNGVMAVSGRNTENPKFTVQYYAYIDRLITSENMGELGVDFDPGEELSVINTSRSEVKDNTGKVVTSRHAVLPENGKPETQQMMDIYANTSGIVQHQRALTEIFESRSFEYFKAPDFTYYDILPLSDTSNNHYTLASLWILKAKPSNSTVTDKEWQAGEENWEKYDINSELKFTNDGELQDTSYIKVLDGTVMRLVYNATKDDAYRNDAAFYDYDITDGSIYTTASTSGTKHRTSEQNDLQKENTVYAYTYKQGINSNGNTLGFGNGEGVVKTGLGDNVGNKGNEANKSGCTFGLVSDSLKNGNLQFTVDAPNLFNDGRAVNGKTGYDGSLLFKRQGDTYTLTGVRGSNSYAKELDQLKYTIARWTPPDEAPGSRGYLFSNEFWPMDVASSYGTDGHDLKFGSYALSAKRQYFDGVEKDKKGENIPHAFVSSDHKQDHNSYFGMNFSVNFSLTADYRGPLEYIFFGDDDMWVYLVGGEFPNGKLVCDIGGVHGTVGQYVNLWDHITQGTAGDYSLYFFYTERGATGSTCWMQFTLPQASSRAVGVDTGTLRNDLQVNKEVSGSVNPDEEFNFKFVLTVQGQNDKDVYKYVRYRADGSPYLREDGTVDRKDIRNGDVFQLKHKEFIRIENLPVGATYTIEEQGAAETYNLETRSAGVSINGTAATGNIKPGDNSSTTEVNLVNRELVKMPETGGSGTTTISVIGAGLLLGGMLIVLRRKREE